MQETRVRVGLALLLLCVAGLGGASYISGADALSVDIGNIFESAGGAHWLGTDDLGRDVLARLAAGVRTSLMVGFVVLGVTASIGITLGLLAGWFGGWVDALIGKMTEVVLSFPGLLLALALAALVGPGMGNVMVALGLLGWVGFCRLTRVEVMRLRGLAFVNAAKLGGVETVTLWGRHILPNCAGPLLVEALLVVAGTMVAEAGLSFLGLGIPAPLPSLGGMLRDGMRDVLVSPALVVWPAVVLICLTVGTNVLAQGFRRVVAGDRREL
ncbi:MAG: ABC transporter permease [Alphaproteobacteria bacterium]|nr:MAG: ABC transporter permease [Alphaproteobacteria bacterium]